MNPSPPLLGSDSGGGETALVLLHGFGAFHGIWRGTRARLGGTIRTIAYDLPGHGGSVDLAGTRPGASAGMVAADLRQRGVTQAHLVGHSMGGAVATLIGMADPALTASLTLLSPGGFGPQINGPLLRRYAETVSREELRACLEEMSGPGFLVPDDTVDALHRMRSAAGQTRSLVEIAAAITRGDRQGEIPRAAIAGLPMPVRLLWGDADPVLPFEQAGGLPSRIAMVRATGAGHMLVEERPDLVLDLIASAIGTP